MLFLNLKITWRRLCKNKLYTLINVAGLAIGLSGCMLIFTFINYHLSFDKENQNSDRIYRFVTNWRYPSYEDYSKGIPVPMVEAARNELQGLEKSGMIIKRGGIIHLRDTSGRETAKSRETFYYAEPGFFEIITRNWVKGSPAESLSAPNHVALSAGTATRFFGSPALAIGKSITIGNGQAMTVTGVFKDSPAPSSFQLNIVVSYATFNSKKYINWDGVNSAMEFYVMLLKGQTAETMAPSIAAFNKKHYTDAKIPGNQRNTLQALGEIHFDPRYGSFSEDPVSKKEIYGLVVIGLFLILTACINFINLSTAQAANRSKEVGIRKVMGGLRKQLFFQFLTETMTITIISMALAFILTELAIPQMSGLLKISLTHHSLFSPVFIGFMALLVMLVGLLAGFYPAIVISGFNPILAIKNTSIVNAGGLGLRKVLVVIQFSITIILLISTFVIIKQMKYVRNKSLGFEPEAVAMISLPSDSLSQSRYESFKEQAMHIPGVKLVSYCQSAPSSDNITSSDFSYRGIKNRDFELRHMKADQDYFRLFDLKFLAGKPFEKNDGENRAVVNETFLKKMGIKDPASVIGQVMNPNGKDVIISGVIRDFNDLSLRDKISPIVIYPQQGEYYSIAVKLESSSLSSAMNRIESLWNSKFPDYIYQSSFLKQDLSGYYESERIMGILFKVSAGVIVFISVLGIFGLISFVAVQRSKEIAIRKILGATTAELIRLLNSSFIKMVIIANLFAWPLAYLFVSRWLQGFEYRIVQSIWPFVYSFAISLGITITTVSIKAYLTATKNVMHSIKYE